MEIKLITDFNEIINAEKLRYEVLNINLDIMEDNYHLLKIKENKMLVFGLYHDDQLASACYVSADRSYLYIDYIFVKEKYQEMGYKFGRLLLTYILDHKDIVEKYFNKELSYCKLEPRGKKAEAIFQKIGFVETNNAFGEYKKRI